MRRVVITGMGAITPLGNDVETFWAGLVAGRSGAASISYFDATQAATQFACEVKNFDVENYLDSKEAKKADRVTHYAMAAVDEALKASKLLASECVLDEVGVIWGTAVGGVTTFEEQMLAYGRGTRFSPFFVPKISLDSTSGWIARKYGFRGMNFAIASACATSNTVLMDVFNYIRCGQAEVMVAGASEAPIAKGVMSSLNAMKGLSIRNDSPHTASRPYDFERDGFVLGEGAGAFVIESLEHAQNRGATVYAEIIGAGMSSDAYHMTATHPHGVGVSLAIQRALKSSNIQLDEVDYINAHATSTLDGDINELKAIHAVFGNHVRNINISATKSMTGHLLGAAGAIEAIACVQSIAHDCIPPTINVRQLDSQIPEGINLTLDVAMHRKVNVAMSNSFGFGGRNAVVVFKKFAG